MRQRVFNDHVCEGRITFEHALYFSGRQINEKYAIVSICEKAHSVGRWLNSGLLDKRKNEFIALMRATDDELRKISRAKDYIRYRDYLQKKYGQETKIQNLRST